METTPHHPARTAGRSWIKWVALGCGGFVLLGLLGVAGLVTLVVGGMKRSEAFQQAMEVAQASPEARAHLGEPIRAGRFVRGSIHVTGPGGAASLAIPLRGPQGRGTLYVEATKSAGRWSSTHLALELRDTGERINLLASPGTHPAREGLAAEAAAEAPQPPAIPAGPPQVGSPAFATSVEGLRHPTDRFAAGVTTVYAHYEYANVAPDQPIGDFWYIERELISEQHVAPRDVFGPQAASSGSIYVSRTLDDGFPRGDYRVDLWLGDRRVASAGFVVE
jgi:hypothetical protein